MPGQVNPPGFYYSQRQDLSVININWIVYCLCNFSDLISILAIVVVKEIKD